MAAIERQPSGVASPCVSVCRIDDASGLCAGCLRTLDEIASWSVLDDDAKRAVIAAIARRRAGLAARRFDDDASPAQCHSEARCHSEADAFPARCHSEADAFPAEESAFFGGRADPSPSARDDTA